MVSIELGESDPMWVHSDTEDAVMVQDPVEAFVEASLAQNWLLAEQNLPEAPDAPTERLRDLWKELLNRAATSIDDRLSISAESVLARWNPALHPRGPDGKFVERPYDVPDELAQFSSETIVRQLARDDPEFESKVEDLNIDGLDELGEIVREEREIGEQRDGDETTPGERREAFDTVELLDEIEDPSTVEEGDVIGFDEHGNTRAIEVTENRVDAADNRIIRGELVKTGTEKAVRPANKQIHQVDPTSEPDVDINWVGDPTERTGAILDSMDRWVPLGNDAPMDRAKDIPISDEMGEEVKRGMAGGLVRAKDQELAERTVATLGQVGDETTRSSETGKHLGDGAERQVVTMGTVNDATAKHELMHAVANQYGLSGQNNKLAWEHEEWQFTDTDKDTSWDADPKSINHPATQYAVNHPDGDNRSFGQDEWKPKVDSELSGNDLDSRNFTSISDDWWPQRLEEGTMLQFDPSEQGPLASFDNDGTHIWRVSNIRDPEPDEDTSPSTEKVARLEDATGRSFEVDVRSRNSQGFRLKSRDFGESGILPGLAGKRESTPDGWGVPQKDPDEYLGKFDESEPVDQKMRDLGKRANEAWYRQAATKHFLDEGVAKGTVIGHDYSSTNAHETMTMMHEMMQSRDKSATALERTAESLLTHHPEFLDRYRTLFDLHPDAAESLNDKLEELGAEFRFDTGGEA